MTASPQDELLWACDSPEATMAAAEALGRRLVGGLAIALIGPLGAGKTHFVKGLAIGNGAGHARGVTSPTFVLMNEYEGRFKLYHLDAYRLPDASAVAALGFDELLTPESVVVVEWADRVPSLMPEDSLWIELHPRGPTQRELRARARSRFAGMCLSAWAETLR
ncbi:MAG: tRNA (adenosine(37)-N6)-threonylcarbamoyltransferase complex ATPase subunit type 1 TsaE [Phycisphaerae bacterium]|nr:tRNA (adenosine(37)-N6)-threonylcarbamoyltransferase complex ATPase subunit type 1 TsaE [Phycisphaerae bacterium]